MRLALHGWRLRESARHALAAGNPEQASELAEQAQSIHRTPAGEALRAIAAWLRKNDS